MFPYCIYDLGYGYGSGHQYSFVLSTNRATLKSLTFTNRNAAMEEMYKDMQKYGLTLNKVWDDNHDKTYICNDGYEFHINRI